MSSNLTTLPESLKWINSIKHKMPLINVLMSLMLELISIETLDISLDMEVAMEKSAPVKITEDQKLSLSQKLKPLKSSWLKTKRILNLCITSTALETYSSYRITESFQIHCSNKTQRPNKSSLKLLRILLFQETCRLVHQLKLWVWLPVVTLEIGAIKNLVFHQLKQNLDYGQIIKWIGFQKLRRMLSQLYLRTSIGLKKHLRNLEIKSKLNQLVTRKFIALKKEITELCYKLKFIT